MCQHEGFHAEVRIARITDPGQPLRFMADITVRCAACREAFRFLGVDAGLSFERPMVSVDGLILTAPIEPERIPMLARRMRYEMPPEIPEDR